MRRSLLATLALTVLVAGLSFGQGPLTNALNLMVRTDSNGALFVYGVAAGAQGPLRNFGNTMLRTYGSGDLAVTINGGTITPDIIDLGGADGVRLSTDDDGAITFLGLGNGSDEDLTLNLDDTANTGVFSSSTGLTALQFSAINLQHADGTAAAPSVTFASDTTKGFWDTGSNLIGVAIAGATRFIWFDGGIEFRAADRIGWSSTSNPAGLEDLIILRDAANTRAWRNGTANQTGNNYARYVSTTNFNRTASKDISTAVTAAVGATVTAANLIPDGCALVSVTTSVTTGLGVTTGTTGYSVGDGSDPDRWGTVVGTAAGTDTDNTDWTVTTIQLFTAAQNVVLTATGGNFDGTGVIQTHVGCLVGEAE